MSHLLPRETLPLGAVGSVAYLTAAMPDHQPVPRTRADLPRVFRAEFHDQAANKVSKDVNVALT